MKTYAPLFLGVCCLVGITSVTSAQGPRTASADQRFVRQLVKQPDERPDLRRLSHVYFGAASTLASGTTSLQILGNDLLSREPDREQLSAILAGPLQRLQDSTRAFQAESADLLDDPESRLVLYRTSQAALESCWRLDAYLRLLETYGATSRELLGSISLRENCNTVRTASFAPSVRGVIREALVDEIFQRAELAELREEVEALEALLDELLDEDEEP